MSDVDVRTEIARVIASPAEGLVARYFDESGPFAGSTFDLLGQDQSDSNRISAKDLLATSLLDVAMPARFTREVLGTRAAEVRELLEPIPTNVDLWDATEPHLEAATAAWDWFRTSTGIGPVKAGKLLARKRPRLVPVIDRVVMEQLRLPRDRYWRALRSALADERLRCSIEDLRPDGLDRRISTLRLLDAAVWMRGSNSRNAKEARAAVGL